MADNPELEAAIEAEPDDEDGYHVSSRKAHASGSREEKGAGVKASSSGSATREAAFAAGCETTPERRYGQQTVWADSNDCVPV